jgi:hypothetical protein
MHLDKHDPSFDRTLLFSLRARKHPQRKCRLPPLSGTYFYIPRSQSTVKHDRKPAPTDSGLGYYATREKRLLLSCV